MASFIHEDMPIIPAIDALYRIIERQTGVLLPRILKNKPRLFLNTTLKICCIGTTSHRFDFDDPEFKDWCRTYIGEQVRLVEFDDDPFDACRITGSLNFAGPQA